MAGLELDLWQRDHLTASLGENEFGLWAALECGLVAPRQNGKNGLCEARQLTGLFLLEELLQIHSAHMADTAVEQFLRLEALIDGTPEFSRRVRKISRGKGVESIQLHRNPKTGLAPRLTFRTRTGGGGRGFSCDVLYLDEAMILSEAFHGTLMPTLSARPNPQLWYTGSAVDKEEPAHDGIVLSRVRDRAIKGGDPSLVYAEFSVECDSPELVSSDVAMDPEAWAESNPALGTRITADYILKEQRSMSHRAFAVERLGVGDWPDPDGMESRPINPETWAALTDRKSEAMNPVCFAIDTTPDRARTAIGVAGRRTDGRYHLEVIDHERGTGWAPARLAELTERHECLPVALDATGPVGSLIPDLEQLGVRLMPVNAREHAQACGTLYDLVEQDQVRHMGSDELAAAIAGAVKRPLGEAWAWSRKNSGVDISPLVAVTLGLWGAHSSEQNYTGPLLELV